jgi:hypothetical protein
MPGKIEFTCPKCETTEDIKILRKGGGCDCKEYAPYREIIQNTNCNCFTEGMDILNAMIECISLSEQALQKTNKKPFFRRASND